MKYQSIIDQMTLEEKVALCSGKGQYTAKAFEKYGIPGIAMNDGPHGLRKLPSGDEQFGINNSLPATCFPTASLTACSWDRDLLHEMGIAIAEEALQEQVSIVLGPGANIKRNPLCGRNFEYFSEDPFLAGEMAASWIDGVQSLGVGASLKHLAGNNQEDERMSSDSLVDERTLREIYLPAFEKAVKSARPATVMCAYNKLNGIYCSDNRYLLRDILRNEWGFQGVIMTDWGAMNDRVKAFEAGLDLEMPGSNGYFDHMVITAIQNGQLSEERLDESVDRLLDLILASASILKKDYKYDEEEHHLLAKKIAANSAVLLRNEENILPVQKGKQVALVGELAKYPRYQGAGSSHINPTRLSSAIDGFNSLGYDYTYYPGYALKGPAPESLLAEAVAGAKECDVAIIFAGLPDQYESEGYDRANMAMPDSHNTLIARIAEVNPNTVVVLAGGAPVEMPWLPKVKAVLNMYLAGQAGGLAAAELLAGAVNPSGKLAESYPQRYADVPSAGFYKTGRKQAQYREGLYIGYRYYDKARKNVLFPFGHGLSYTSFEYRDLVVSHAELHSPYELNVSVTVRNTGSVDGAEVVQLYVSDLEQPVFRPEKELKEFTKVFLKAGEEKQITFTLNSRSFAIYDPAVGNWVVPDGTYAVLVGASSRDIRLRTQVKVHGQPVPSANQPIPRWYHDLSGQVTQADFESLLCREIEPVKLRRKGEYTLDCTFGDMQDSLIIKQVIKRIEKMIIQGFGSMDADDPTYKMVVQSVTSMPLRSISLVSPQSMPKNTATGLVHLANGEFLKGILALVKKK